MQYSYDTTGAIFSYFLVTLFSLLLIPFTLSRFYSLIFAGDSAANTGGKNNHIGACRCKACQEKVKFVAHHSNSSTSAANASAKASQQSWLALLVAWIIFAFILRQAFTLQVEKQQLWDPYEILGIDRSSFASSIDSYSSSGTSSGNGNVAKPDSQDDDWPAAEEEKSQEEQDELRLVKKAFKKLSLVYHPDKVAGGPEEKAAASIKFVEISKAYKVLTDPVSRQLYEEFGHPDGKQAFELGLALPAWLVSKENGGFVLLIYAIAFGILLPLFVSRMWRSAKSTSKNKIQGESMGVFYRSCHEGLNFWGVLGVLVNAVEFEEVLRKKEGEKEFPVAVEEREWRELQKSVQAGCAKASIDYMILKKGLLFSPVSSKTHTLILSHLLRIPLSDESAFLVKRAQVVEQASLLVHGMLQISNSRNWIRASLAILDFSQMLMQAMIPGQSQLFQLPLISSHPDLLKSLEKAGVSSLSSYTSKPLEKRHALLTPALTEKEFEVVEQVSHALPKLELAKAEYGVHGDPVIVPGSLVTLSVKFRCIYPPTNDVSNEKKEEVNNEIPSVDEEKDQKRKWWVALPPETHAPHTPYALLSASRRPTFSVILANAKIGRLIGAIKLFGASEGLDHVGRIQFQAPPEEGSWTFQVWVKSDTWVGCADLFFDLELTCVSTSELPYENFDDTISEPEDSLIAGNQDDLSDEDDEEEEEGEQKKVKKVKASPSKKKNSKNKNKVKRKPIEERGEYDDSSDSDEYEDEVAELEEEGDDEVDTGPTEDFVE